MYRTDWKTILAVLAVGGVITVASTYSAADFTKWLQGSGAFLGAVVAVVGSMTAGSYATVSNGTLKFVYLFFYRRRIRIDAITEISDQSTYKVASSMFRSVYIFYNREDGIQKYIELRMGVFPKVAITGLIGELKERNPKIILSEFCEKLIKTTG